MTFANLPPVDLNRRYNIPEAGAYLHCCRAKVFAKIKSGELRVIRDGGRTLVPGTEIARLSQLPELNAA